VLRWTESPLSGLGFEARDNILFICCSNINRKDERKQEFSRSNTGLNYII